MPAFKFPDEIDDKDKDVEITVSSDEVEVEIVDDTPEKDRGRKPLDREIEDPTDEEIESYSDGVQKRIRELTHARHDERRAKESLFREKQELERLAQHMVSENTKLKEYVKSGTEQYAASIKQVADGELENAKRQYKAAYESGDADALVAAQEAMTDAKMRTEAAKNFRAPPLQDAETTVQTQPQVSRPEIDEKTVRWQAKNQWFGSTGYEEHTSFALGLHQKLVNNGVDPRSDSYFEQIDARVKSKFPEVFGENDERSRSSETPRRPSSVVAPASRSTGTRKIQLTPTQAALIKKYNLDPKKYVAEVLKLENQNG